MNLFLQNQLRCQRGEYESTNGFLECSLLLASVVGYGRLRTSSHLLNETRYVLHTDRIFLF